MGADAHDGRARHHELLELLGDVLLPGLPLAHRLLYEGRIVVETEPADPRHVQDVVVLVGKRLEVGFDLVAVIQQLWRERCIVDVIGRSGIASLQRKQKE